MPEPKEKINSGQDNPQSTETKSVEKIEYNDKSDKFSLDERKKIVKIVKDDVEFGERIQEDFVAQKEVDLKHYHCVKPSEIENLNKKEWHSDRNLGLARAVADSYISTFFATSWTPDSIKAVNVSMSNYENLQVREKFIKWGMGKQEADMGSAVYDFIHNRVIVGNSCFKIYRKIWEEWVDTRVPIKDKKTGETLRYEIKTEKKKFSRGVIENIADIDDILVPQYGKNIQELPFFVHKLHLDGEKVLDLLDRKVLVPRDVEAYKKRLYIHAFKEKERTLGKEKLSTLGITEESIGDLDIRRLTIDLYEWYGYFSKDSRNEKYRMIVDLENEEFLSGKPLRKINRSGKIPFVLGALSKEPGMVRGVSTMQIIAPIVNAFNNVFNQKSDFQYVSNCPFGFYNPDEGYTKQRFDLEPGVAFPVNGDPSRSVYFPNLSRSMAWAESDIRILLEILERLTGAATFFQSTSRGVSGTATRDMLIDKNSETRFGLGVFGIQADIAEAISMWFEMYQDFPPKGLAERVVGEDGKKLFPNLSIDSLRGDTDIQLTPDIVSGSKAYRKELQLWAFSQQAQSIWLNPQVNPQGNWNLTADTFKQVLGMTDNDVRRYIGEQPKMPFNQEDLDEEFYRFMNGEDFDPPEGETAIAMQHLQGHYKQKEEKYDLLDKEYRPNFDAHVFKTLINAMKFMKQQQTEMIANQLAAQVVTKYPQGLPQPSQPQMINQGQSGQGIGAMSQGQPQQNEQIPGAMQQEQPVGGQQGGV